MVEVLNDVPLHVSAFRVSGEVTKEDYQSVILPMIDEMVKATNKIHFLLLLETDISNFTAGAVVQDLWLGLKNITKWHRMAIVTDQSAVRTFTDAASFPLPGEAKGFSTTQLEDAKKWVAE